MKCSAATPVQKMDFVSRAVAMLNANKEVRIDCIVANKQNVQAHIRTDPNKLYNYMCRCVIPDYVKGELEFEFVPDKRSIKVRSGNSLADYLQIVLWFEYGLATKLINSPQESDKNYNLQFMDWIAHCVWAHFERGEEDVFTKLSPAIKIRHLFF